MENNEVNLKAEDEKYKNGDLVENVDEEIQIKKMPIFLGYRPNDFSITWHYDNMSLSRVGFMHPDYNHLFIQYVLKESRNRGIRLLRITTENNPIETNGVEPFPLLEMELKPTFDRLTELEETRMKWVQLYLKLICYINKADRATFIPQLKYFRGSEGPLAGYIRSVDEMPDSKNKEILNKHFRKLILVDWELVNNEVGDKTTDYVYVIKGETFNDKLEAFFIGCWCILNIHYSRDFEDFKPQQILTLMQFGEDLLIPEIDNEAKSIIEETIKLIANLTLPSLDHLEVNQFHALFIQSPLLFPNVYPSVSHMIYGVEQTRDFNLSDLIEGLGKLATNEALYRSKVVLPNGAEFVKKVYLPVEY